MHTSQRLDLFDQEYSKTVILWTIITTIITNNRNCKI